jgi:uncharacterized protein YbjT (DUF2867 family)
LPLVGGGKTWCQLFDVGDVAEAVMKAIEMPTAAGQTYELAGPKIYNFAELMRLMLHEIGRKRALVPLPFPVASLMGAVMQCLPMPQLTVDQVRQLKRDNLPSAGSAGLTDLGITPTSVETIIPTYLDRYRARSYYHRP